MTEPQTAYRVVPDPDPAAGAALAAWIQYQAQRCRELALQLEVEAAHLSLSGLADNTDGMVSIRDTASRLASRTNEIARRCRERRITR